MLRFKIPSVAFQVAHLLIAPSIRILASYEFADVILVDPCFGTEAVFDSQQNGEHDSA